MAVPGPAPPASSSRSSRASRPDSPETNWLSTASWSFSLLSTWLIRLAARLASSTGVYVNPRPARWRASSPLACSRDTIVTTVL